MLWQVPEGNGPAGRGVIGLANFNFKEGQGKREKGPRSQGFWLLGRLVWAKCLGKTAITELVIQWLRLCIPVHGLDLILGQGLDPHTLQLRVSMP